MVIVFVIDFFTPINGTSMTAIRFRDALQKKGHTVRVVSVNVSGENMYSLKERYIPITSDITRKQNMVFAKVDLDILEKAFDGADIIHFFLPYKLAWEGKFLADRMHIPSVVAFHCQPENVTFSLGLGWFKPLAHYIYNRFNNKVYKYFDHIHAPSKFIANEMLKHNYKAKIHIFSNGVSEKFVPGETVENNNDFYYILSTGRLVTEKRQDILIKAIHYSKYKEKIKLILAGDGPKKKYYQKLGEKLPNKIHIEFYNEDQLIKVIQKSYLYVHPAEVEIEAIACLEAMSCGKVPLIANSNRSATPQFALDHRSLFKLNDFKELAKKIDYWIENPEEKKIMEQKYLEQASKYKLDHIINKALNMYEEAITDYHKFHPIMIGINQKNKPFTPKIDFIPPDNPHAHIDKIKKIKNIKFDENYPYVNNNIFFKIATFFIKLTLIILVFPWMKYRFGLKIIGREKLKNLKKKHKGGIISVSNHIHNWDFLFNLKALMPHKLFCPILKENIESKDGILMRLVNLIPIPDTSYKGMGIFIKSINNLLKKGKFVHFYPETSRWTYYQPVRPFKPGAFDFAVKNSVPVLPIGFSYRQGKKGKIYITVTIEDPIFPDKNLDYKLAVEKLTNQAREAVIKACGIQIPFIDIWKK